jgi:F420-dependent oxidoreductase-like protein
MKLGVMYDAQDGMTWELWQRAAAQAEALGFESLWRSDHLFSVVNRPERPALEAWTSLTYVATATRRLRFGPLVSPITLRHPALLALAAASVDVLSGGRLELGLGAGWDEHEHRAFGVPFPDVRSRMEMLAESIAVTRLLWTGDEAHFAGRHYTLDGARGHPRPDQRPGPPIIVAGTGERRLLRIVAEQADEWNAHGVGVEIYRRKLATLAHHCEAVQRDVRSIRRSFAGALAVASSAGDLKRRIDTLAEMFPLPVFFPPGAGRAPEDLRARGWFAGTPEEIVDQVEALAAEGVERVMFQQLDPADGESIELLGETVLPHF